MKTGELTSAVKDRSVFRQLHTGETGTAAGPLPGYEDMPWRQVTAAANSFMVTGAAPQQLILQGLIPRKMEESALRETMRRFAAEADNCGMTFCSVNIQVSSRVSSPQYFVTGIGVHGDFAQDHENKAPGQELVVVRQIGLAGTAALARAYELALQERFPAWLIDRAKGFDRWMSLTEAARAVSRFGGCSMYRIAQGGIFNALWEMADALGVGLEVDLREIPVYQETIELCEYFDINPYYLYSEGALLVATDQAEALIAALSGEGIPACVIGRTTGGNDRVIRNGESRRFLDRPQQDELWRFSEKEI